MERMQLIMSLRVIVLILSLLIIDYYFFKKLKRILVKQFHLVEEKVKRILSISLLLVNLFPLYFILGMLHFILFPKSTLEFPDTWMIDFLFRLPGWLFIVWLVQVTLIVSPIDIITFLFLRIKKVAAEKFQNFTDKVFLIVSVFFLFYVPLRAYYDYKNVEVVNRIYTINDVNFDLDQLRIVFISDLQMDRFTNEERVTNYVNKINELKPDLVLIGGDFITRKDLFIYKIANITSKIKSNLGVYSCIGDHDFYAFKKEYWRSLDTMKNVLRRYNVNMIDNGNVLFQINDTKIKVTFLSNTYVKSLAQKVIDSLSQFNENFGLKILVSHQPDESIAKKASAYGYNLYLSGHTHGGQVLLAFPFVKLTPVMFETKYLSGDFLFGNLLMIVNRGLGYSTIPFRYNVTPEISLIEIKQK